MTSVNNKMSITEQEAMVVKMKPHFKCIIGYDGEVITDGEVLERIEGMLEERALTDTKAYKLLSAPRDYSDEGMVLDDLIALLDGISKE